MSKKIQRFKETIRELEILSQIKLQQIKDDSSGKLEYLQFLAADMIVNLEKRIKFFEKTLKEIEEKQKIEEVKKPLSAKDFFERIEKKVRNKQNFEINIFKQ